MSQKDQGAREVLPEGDYEFSGTYTSEAGPRLATHPSTHESVPQSGGGPTERLPTSVSTQNERPNDKQLDDSNERTEGNVSNMQHFDLPPITKERYIQIPRPRVVENVIEVPHVQYIERVEEVPQIRKVPRVVHVPKVEITERVIEIPKHVREEKIVEVPQLQIVDHVLEVPQYITQQKIIEVPRTMLQERIIPIPRRIIEEKIVEVPEDQFAQILRERVEYATPAYGPASQMRYPQTDDGQFATGDEYAFGPDGKPIVGADGRPLIRQRQEQRLGPPMGGGDYDEYGSAYSTQGRYTPSRPVDEVVEVPHVQHVYRNIMQPVYRHIPKPVEVPLTHYRPIPIERVIDRNVPIPVELEVVQEFLCPRVEAKYVEVPVPIPVTRIIEKPVPADAMFNSVIMDAYMRGQVPVVSPCIQSCGGGVEVRSKPKMTSSELQAAGLSAQPSFSQIKSFKSRGQSFAGFNLEKSKDFFTHHRTLIPEGKKE